MLRTRRHPVFTRLQNIWRVVRAFLRRSLLGQYSYLNLFPYEAEYQADRQPKKLGEGGMGVTIKGFDARDGTPVALKLIKTTGHVSKAALKRFRLEARAAMKCVHPNIARVFHFGDTPSNYFYAMEYIEGETLRNLLRRVKRLPAVTALPLMAQLASALTKVHSEKLIHRDLKPSNIMLVRDEKGQPQIKLIDFGLVKSLEADASDSSLSGGVTGTIIYASPEQFPPKRTVDERSDLYSLGVILWLLLVGKPPFSHQAKAVMMVAQKLGDLPCEKLEGQPPVLIHFLKSLLQEDPAKRPANAAEAEKALWEMVYDLEGNSSIQPALPLEEMFPADLPVGGLDQSGESQSAPTAGFLTIEDLLRKGNGSLNPRRFLALLSPLAALVDETGEASQLDLRPAAVRIYPPAIGGNVPEDDAEDDDAVRVMLFADAEEMPADDTPQDKVRRMPFTDAAGEKYVLWLDVWTEQNTALKDATILPERPAASGHLLDFARLCYEMLGGQVAWVSRGGYTPLSTLTDEGNQFLRIFFTSPARRMDAASTAQEIADRLEASLRKRDDPAPSPPDPGLEAEVVSPPAQAPLWRQSMLTGRIMVTFGIAAVAAYSAIREIPALPLLLPWRVLLALLTGAGAVSGFTVVLREIGLKRKLRALVRKAEQGNAVAQSGLGELYYRGRHCPLDYQEAFQWHLKAANQHLKESQFRVAHMQETGQGTVQNELAATAWYWLAAARGHPVARRKMLDGWRTRIRAMSKAQMNKDGVERDDASYVTRVVAEPIRTRIEEHVADLRRRARRNDVNAQFQLAYRLAQGWGVPQDEEEAAYWYGLAADRGLPAAQNNFGSLCATGRGVGRNEERAAAWYARAAAAGNDFAKFNLAYCYAAGRGVKQDRSKAFKLLRDASQTVHAANKVLWRMNNEH